MGVAARYNDHRWRTTFGKWVREYGVPRLATELQVTPSAIYFWLRPTGRVVYPDPDRAFKMVELSGNSLILENIYGHRREAKRIRLEESGVPGNIPVAFAAS